MRFFCFILSVYIIGLTAIPCIDKPLHKHVEKSEIAGKTHHHHDDGDDCSPFCTCNCCATMVIQQDVFVHFDQFALLQEFKMPEYVSAFTSSYLNSIWQPPQVG